MLNLAQKIKKIRIGKSLAVGIFCAVLVLAGFGFAGTASAAYYSSGTATSTNLLIGETVSSIDSFVYNLSAKPANTDATIQFSQDNTNWYNSSGVLDGTDTLTTGVNNTINLSGLGWSGANFYYAVTFTSDGVDTPVLDDISVIFTSNQAPNTPTNTSPTDGATGQNLNVTLTGSAYSDTESDPQTDANWQVDDDADFATPVWTRTAGAAETTTTVNGGNGTFANELAGKTELDHNTTYYWQVRYSDGAWSSYSASTTFATNLVNAPTNSSPANGATVSTLTPLLEASAFSDDQSGHTHAASQWQVDDNSDFSSTAYDSGETASGETSRAVPGGNLSNFTTYYWHVRYKDSSGFWSEYSATTNFEISITATAVEVRPVFGNTTVDQGDNVKIDVQVINFTDGSPLNNATSTINIYNPSGTKIVDGATMTYVSGSNGIYRYPYTVPSVSGSYLYEVTAIQGTKSGYSASNFEVRTIAADIASALANINSLISKMVAADGTVNDSSATTTVFDTNLSESTNDHYNDGVLIFTLGNNAGQVRRITDYDGTAKTITVDPALSSAPANGDTFSILGQSAVASLDASSIWSYGTRSLTTASLDSGSLATLANLQSTETTITADIADVDADLAAHESSQATHRAAQTSFRTDTTSRLTTLQTDVDSIQSDVTGIKSTLTSIQTDIDTLESKINDLATDHDDIISDLNDIVDDVGSIVSEVNKIKTDTTDILDKLEIGSTGKDIRNKLAELKAVLDVIKTLGDKTANAPTIKVFYTEGSVVINVLIANPSTENEQVVPIQTYLPEEIKPENILDLDGMDLKFDPGANTYYATGEFTLSPGESTLKKIRMEDIWNINENIFDDLRRQAEDLLRPLENTAFFAQGTILKNEVITKVEEMRERQNEHIHPPQQHIGSYRTNMNVLKEVRQNIEAMKQLNVQAGASQNLFGSIGGIQTFSTWGIILAIVFGFGLLAAVIFAMWRHQTMLAAVAMGMNKQEVAAHFGGVLPRSRWRKLAKEKRIAETRPQSARTSFIWHLSWKKILIWFVVIGMVAILGIVTVKFAPGLFGSREVKFENEETPAVAPTAPKENSIGSKLVPDSRPAPLNQEEFNGDNVKVFFSNGEDKEKDEAVSESVNPTLKITDTPTGWLNVRDAASLDGRAIAKVYPGEKYEYTDEKNGWYQIVLTDGGQGWIFGKFAELLEE